MWGFFQVFVCLFSLVTFLYKNIFLSCILLHMGMLPVFLMPMIALLLSCIYAKIYSLLYYPYLPKTYLNNNSPPRYVCILFHEARKYITLHDKRMLNTGFSLRIFIRKIIVDYLGEANTVISVLVRKIQEGRRKGEGNRSRGREGDVLMRTEAGVMWPGGQEHRGTSSEGKE